MPSVPSPADKRRTPFPIFLLWAFALIITLAVVYFVATSVFARPRPARVAATQAVLSIVVSMVRTYNLDTGDYPPTLDALVPKYLEKPPLDAWKRPFVYTLSPARPPFTLGSLGADGQTGGSGDDADIFAQLP